MEKEIQLRIMYAMTGNNTVLVLLLHNRGVAAKRGGHWREGKISSSVCQPGNGHVEEKEPYSGTSTGQNARLAAFLSHYRETLS